MNQGAFLFETKSECSDNFRLNVLQEIGNTLHKGIDQAFGK